MTPRTPITGEEVADVLERAAALLEQPGAWSALPSTGDAWGDKRTTQWSVWTVILRAARYATEAEKPIMLFDTVAYDERGNARFGRSQEADVKLLRSAATAARQQGEGK